MKKLYLTFAILAVLIPTAVHALNGPSALNGGGGINSPGLWIPNQASSTITPQPNTLQIPCANIVGGCGVSTSSLTGYVTSSSNTTFTGVNAFNATTTQVGPLLFGDASNVIVPKTFTGDWGTYVNNLCAAGLTVASSVNLHFGNMQVPSSSWTVGINLGTTAGRCALSGMGGLGTTWNWGGGTSTPAITLNDSSVSGNLQMTQFVAMQGIAILGCGANLNCTLSTSTPTIGVLAGGTNGAAHQLMQYNYINGFGNDVVIASNTYDFYVEHNTIVNGGVNLTINPANNATEGIHIENNWMVDPANSNPNDCVLVQSTGGDNIDYSNNTTDDCQIHQKNGTTMFISGNKTEHPNPSYPNYIPFLQDSSPFSSMIITGEKVFFGGGASSSYTELADVGSTFSLTGLSIDIGGTSTTLMQYIVQNDLGSTYTNWRVCDVTTNVFLNKQTYTTFSPNSIGVPTTTFNGCVTQYQNGSSTWSGSQLNGDYQIQASRLFATGNFVASGTVGIGTTTPANKLSVAGSADFQRLAVGTTVTSTAVLNVIGNVSEGSTTITGQSAQLSVTNGTQTVNLNSSFGGSTPGVQVVSNDPLGFYTNNTLRMQISSSGHSGYPTTSPTDNNGTVVGSDNVGVITIATSSLGSGSSTLTFATAWNSIPVCVGNAASSAIGIVRQVKPTTSSVMFLDSNPFPTSSQIDYMCFGNPN